MTGYAWLMTGAWLLVAAVALAAHLFGREARAIPSDETDSAERARSRLGVAISITGPIAAFLVGFAVALTSGAWAVVGLVTVLAIVAIAAIGLYLAPQ